MSIPLIFQTHEKAHEHFFPVDGKSLFAINDKGNYCEMSDHKAIINQTTGEALSIVRMNFLIVSHEEAFQIGCKIFESLFGKSPKIGSQKSTQSGITYTVELISDEVRVRITQQGFQMEGVKHWKDFLPQTKNRESDFRWDDAGIMWPVSSIPQPVDYNTIPEASIEMLKHNLVPHGFEDFYHPFVRVHNHLREQAGFTIEMGYYRSRCTNGVMFGTRNAMTYKTNYHSIMSVAALELQALHFFTERKSNLFHVMGDLFKTLSMPISRADMHLIALSVFKEKFLAMEKSHRKSEYEVLLSIANHYTDEIGCNMNAAMNVATEYAQRLYSNGRVVSGIQQMPSMLLRKIGSGRIRIASLLRRLRKEEEYILNHEGIHNIVSWEED